MAKQSKFLEFFAENKNTMGITLKRNKVLLPIECYAYFNKLTPNEAMVNIIALKLKYLAFVQKSKKLHDVVKTINNNNVENIAKKYGVLEQDEGNNYFTNLSYYKDAALNDHKFSDFVVFYVRNVRPPKSIEEAVAKIENCFKYLPMINQVVQYDILKNQESLSLLYKELESQLKNITIKK